ncbi:asparagine synthase (glutamine-hydrolyzing) [Candidatus Kaiserbacteria bacterium]|nr:asparagine synthase (glutamine-hydrolyzing) [Candidatus Kaiserbacteria bacterium]
MCGIAGSINTKKDLVPHMLRDLAHRGPDDEGLYLDEVQNVVLGHRRLSIIDVSSAGHQPMESPDSSVVVSFNGEIYNYRVLGEELRQKGYSFHSASDTEVLIHGYREWGIDIFKKIDGMWAIALYDQKEGKLHLSRDPAGIKPLYIYQKEKALIFASEIGAVARAVGHSALTMNDDALRAYLTHGYIYSNATVYNEITEVPPATTLTYTLPELTFSSEIHYVPQKHAAPANLTDAVVEFEGLFADSVQKTLQSDVPVGLFLSGGIDSSLVGYHVQQCGSRLHAFTLGFDEQSFDESAVAARIAQNLGFPHETLMVRGSDIAKDVEHVLDSFGEPFADQAALLNYHLSRHARERGCKVVLTGDGADELFGGYQTHYLPTLARWYQQTPRITDRLLEQVAGVLPRDFSKLGHHEKLTRFLHGARYPFDVAHAKWKQIFTNSDLEALLAPDSSIAEAMRADFSEFFDAIRAQSNDPDGIVSKVDFMTFLPSSCLVKSDICAMQHGVEIRVPFLNKALIDFAWHLPADMKTTPFHTKKVLRASLARFLPSDIAQAPKQGFVPPLALWLTRELKPILLDTLSHTNVAKVGFLQYGYIASLIEQHLSERADNSKKIWALMSLVRFYTRPI